MKSTNFDFNLWSNVAKQDPEQFELMRQQLIDDVMAQVPEELKQRMEGVQWEVDQIQNRAENPMAACFSISQRMLNKVHGEKGLLATLSDPKKILQDRKKMDLNNVISITKYKK